MPDMQLVVPIWHAAGVHGPPCVHGLQEPS